MKKLIRVTYQHIMQGVRKDSTKCMIALAIQDTLPQALDIHVCPLIIKFILNDERQRSDFSKIVRHNMHLFDNSLEVKPFNFYIDLD